MGILDVAIHRGLSFKMKPFFVISDLTHSLRQNSDEVMLKIFYALKAQNISRPGQRPGTLESLLIQP
jgi:hypothetical protein